MTARSLKKGEIGIIKELTFDNKQQHQRMMDLLDKGEKLPFDIEGSAIYYVGPSPTKPGRVIGSAGPTTSYRMDQ